MIELQQARMQDISPQQIVEWFRAKAREFNGLADTLERTFTSSGSPAIGKSADAVRAPSHKIEATTSGQTDKLLPLAEQIRFALRVQGHRISTLAAFLNTTEEAIMKEISRPWNGFYVGDRGWIKIQESKPSDPPSPLNKLT